MSNGRQTQHRPKREEQKSKELHDVKRENNNLKRKLAKLRKENEKLRTLSGIETPPEESSEVESSVSESAPEPDGDCEKCQGETIEMVFFNKTFRVCKGCKHRKVTKTE